MDDELRQEVQQARRRHRWWIALAATVAANGAISIWLHAASRRAPMTVTINVEAPPAPVPVVAPRFIFLTNPEPPAPAVAFADLGPCPAPHAEAPPRRFTQPFSTPDLVGVTAARTDTRWLAAWNEDQILVSHDAGASWDRVLDGAGDIIDVSFDCHGRVVALRTVGGLGVRDGTREAWRPVNLDLTLQMYDESGFSQAHLVAGARAVAVVGPGLDDGSWYAAITDDLGASWRLASLGYGQGSWIAAAWDGDVLRSVARGSEWTESPMRIVTVSPRGIKAEETAQLRWPMFDGARIVGQASSCPPAPDDDTAYVDGNLLCTRSPGGRWRVLPGLAADDLMTVAGPVNIAIAGGEIHRIGAHRVGRGRAWPDDARVLTSDLAGRVWGVSGDGRLIGVKLAAWCAVTTLACTICSRLRPHAHRMRSR